MLKPYDILQEACKDKKVNFNERKREISITDATF